MGGYMSVDYLVDAANKMFALVPPGDSEVSKEDLASALRTGCTTLRRLKGDRQFFMAVDRLQTTMLTDGRHHTEFLDGVLGLTDAFLALEKTTLLDAGLAPELVEHLLRRAQEVSKELGDPDLDVVRLRQALARLELRVCQSAEELKKADDAEERQAAAKDIARGAIWTLAGAAVIGTNAAAATALGPAAAALSGAAGGAVIKKVVEVSYERSTRASQKREQTRE
jgi:hypothetical protein